MLFSNDFRSFFRGKELIKNGIQKVTHPGLTSEELLIQVNLTSDALKKQKKVWTESDESELEGIVIIVKLQGID